MSTEQPQPESAHAQDDITQQATTPTPTTKQKNPKRVAAGKMVAGRTRLAREAQKKALAEAEIIIANNHGQKPPLRPRHSRLSKKKTQKSSEATSRILITTQWLGVGLYYKREELTATLKAAVFSKTPASVELQPTPVQATPTPQPNGLRLMD